MSALARRWRRTRAAGRPVPVDLVADIDDALAELDGCRTRLDDVVRRQAPLAARRAAYVDTTHAFDNADRLLREATALARARSFAEWTRWRARLTRLSSTRQRHLFLGTDTPALLREDSVRALDTGMSGPAIGELQHGMSCPGGSPSYGLDLDVELGIRPAGPAGGTARPPAEVLTLPVPTPSAA
jgi:hypothetical protein